MTGKVMLKSFIQVATNFLGQVGRSELIDKAVDPSWRLRLIVHDIAGLVIIDQMESRVLRRSSSVFLPYAVMRKIRLRRPPLSADAPPIFDFTKPFSSRR